MQNAVRRPQFAAVRLLPAGTTIECLRAPPRTEGMQNAALEEGDAWGKPCLFEAEQ